MKKINNPGTNATCAKPLNEASAIKQQELLISLRKAELETVALFEQTLEALDNLSQIRLKCKLSNSRVAGIYRELKELAKVMSVYN